MNALITIAVVCAAWLALGVLAAHFLFSLHDGDFEETPPVIDLLDRKLNALSVEVASGKMSDQHRRQIVAKLMRHLDTIAAMEQLLRMGPAGSVADAEITHTTDTPELTIRIHSGYMQSWLVELYQLGFADTFSNGPWPVLRGGFTVQLAYRATAPAMGQLQGAAA